jgi:hypothetical protein
MSAEITKINSYIPVNAHEALCKYYESNPEVFAEWRRNFEANPPPPMKDNPEIMDTSEGVVILRPGEPEYEALMEKIKAEDTVIQTIEDVPCTDVCEAGGSGLSSDSEQQECQQ